MIWDVLNGRVLKMFTFSSQQTQLSDVAAARREVSREQGSLPCLVPPARAARMRVWRLGKAGGRRLATPSPKSSWWNLDQMRGSSLGSMAGFLL